MPSPADRLDSTLDRGLHNLRMRFTGSLYQQKQICCILRHVPTTSYDPVWCNVHLASSEFQFCLRGLGLFLLPAAVLHASDHLEATLQPCLVTQHYGTVHIDR